MPVTDEQLDREEIRVEEKIYKFFDTVKEGDLCHRKFKQLAEMGFPILFRNYLVTCRHHTHAPGYISIFLSGPARPATPALKTICTSLEMAQLWAELGLPYEALLWLKETGAPESVQRQILADAYEKCSERAQCGIKDSWNPDDTRYLENRLHLYQQYKAKLLTGEAPIELMPETFS